MPKNPHADFSPTLDGYSGIGAFRFWCQTALPLTYDDSLSYYELLNKVVNYLNHTIEDLTSVESNTSALAEAYNQLQKYINDYFDDLDVEAELRNVLDAMAEDGTLDALLDPIVENRLPGVVEEKIDGVVAEQIDGAVAGQIDESVADQLPALVDAGIPGEVSEWLEDNVDPVGSAVVVDSSLTISGAAADAKVTGDKLSDLKTHLKAFALEGQYLPIKYSDFARGTVLNGVFNPTIHYRVSTPEVVNIPYETTLYVKSGFTVYLYFYDGSSYTGHAVTDSYTIPANSDIIIVIRRTEENTAEVADVAYFVSQINTSNKIKELEEELESTNADLTTAENNIENIKGTFSTRCGTENIDACDSNIYHVNVARFALPAVVEGGGFLDKIVYKSNAIKTIDFYLGLYDSTTGTVTIKEVITCPVIIGLNTLTNGIDFTSETVVDENFAIGYRCDTTENSNGFYGGTEQSLVSLKAYITPPQIGDIVILDSPRSYGVGLYATFKTFSIPELANEISELDAKIEEYHKTEIPWEYAIDKVLCIGDSLTKGSPADSQTMPYPLKENYPYFMERMISVECTNTGVPGITTQNWYKNEYTKYTMSDYNTFIIFLGTNGGLTDTLATDVNPYNDYNDFADTQTGNYCKIIEHIMADKNDDAIIILVNTWYNGSGQDTTRAVIDKIGEKYGLPVIETANTMPYSVNPAYHGNVNNVHCSKAGYLALASLICDGVREYINSNPDFANKSMTQGPINP